MALKFALLAALCEEPMSGYDLNQTFRTRLANVWNASHQQIYKELARLHELALVSVTDRPQQGKPDKRIYHISDAGKEALAEWLNQRQHRPPVRDPLLVKFFAGDLLELSALREELAAIKEDWLAQTGYYRAIEHTYFRAPDQLTPHFRLQYLALRRGILGMETNLRWLEEVETTLNDIDSQVTSRPAAKDREPS